MGVTLYHRHRPMAANPFDGRKVHPCLNEMRDSSVPESVANNLFWIEPRRGYHAHKRFPNIDRVSMSGSNRRKKPGRALRKSFYIPLNKGGQLPGDGLGAGPCFSTGNVD